MRALPNETSSDKVLQVRGRGNCSGVKYGGDNTVGEGHLALQLCDKGWKIQLWHLKRTFPVGEFYLSRRFWLEGFDDSRTFLQNFTLNGRININLDDKVRLRFELADMEKERDVLKRMARIFEDYHNKEYLRPYKVSSTSSTVVHEQRRRELSSPLIRKVAGSPKTDETLRISPVQRNGTEKNKDIEEENRAENSPELELNGKSPATNGVNGKIEYEKELLRLISSVKSPTVNGVEWKITRTKPSNEKSPVINGIDRKIHRVNPSPVINGTAGKSRGVFAEENNPTNLSDEERIYGRNKPWQLYSDETSPVSNGVNGEEHRENTSPSTPRESTRNSPKQFLSSAQCRKTNSRFESRIKSGNNGDYSKLPVESRQSPARSTPNGTFRQSFYGKSHRTNQVSSDIVSFAIPTSGSKRPVGPCKPPESSPKKQKSNGADKENEPEDSVGLRNFGSTCYMNATLQAIFSLDLLMEKLRDKVNDASQDGIWRPLVRLYNSQRVHFDDSQTDVLINFRQHLSDKTNSFANRHIMEDAHECLGKVFSVIEEEWPDDAKYNVITQSISMDVQTVYTCPRCSGPKSKMDRVNDLGISLHSRTVGSKLHLGQLLDDYFFKSVMDCPCDCNEECRGLNKILRRSPILIIQLKRYRMLEGGNSQKIKDPVTIPLELNMKKYCRVVNGDIKNGKCIDDEIAEENENDGFSYTLQSVIEHLGDTTSSGHYITKTKSKDGWRTFDDDKITRVQTNPIREDRAYILFYVLK